MVCRIDDQYCTSWKVFKAMILGTGFGNVWAEARVLCRETLRMLWQRAKYRTAMSKQKPVCLGRHGAATLGSILCSKERGCIEHGQSLAPDTQAGAFFVVPKCVKLSNRPEAAVN